MPFTGQCKNPECGAEFTQPGTRIREYCSQACYRAFGVKQPRAKRKDSGSQRSKWVELVCQNPGCGKAFSRRSSETKNAGFVFCTKRCYGASGATRAGKRGGRPGSPEWKAWDPSRHQPEVLDAVVKYGEPTGWLIDQGYMYLQWKTHPASSSNGRVGEHRVVAYEYVGDAIVGQHVDHINGRRSDNRWENLQVLTVAEHAKKTWMSEGLGKSRDFWEWCLLHHPEVVDEYASVVKGA